MGSSVNVNAFRGILVQDPRINADTVSDALSSYTQAGPHPGVPVPTVASPMSLETSGDTSAGGTLLIRTIRAGGAEAAPDGETQAGQFAFQSNGTNWLGWNGPLVYQGWSPLHTFASGVGANQYTNLHVVHSDVGTQLVAAHRFTSGGATENLVVLRTYAGVTSTTVITTQASARVNYQPCLVKLPNQRLLLLSTYATTGGQYTIRAWTSSDDGVTWTKAADSVIRDALSETTQAPRRLRAAYADGQVLLMLAVRDTSYTIPDTFRQYASVDEGTTFALVEAVSGASSLSSDTGGAHDIVAMADGGFMVAYCGSSRTNYGANSAVLYKLLSSAWVRWTNVGASTLSALTAPSSNLSAGNQLDAQTELALAMDEDGAIYAMSVRFTIGNQTQLAKWPISGFASSWVDLSTESLTTANVQFAAGGLEWIGGTASWFQGTLHLVSQWDSSAWPGQIGTATFAGYTTACVPYSDDTEATPDGMMGSRLTWAPFWLPNNAGWTLATVGAPVVALNSAGYLQVATAVAEVNTYTAAGPAYTVTHTVAGFAEWSAITSASELRLLSSNGTQSYGLRVNINGTTVTVFDHYSGGSLGTYTITSGQAVSIRAFLENDGATGRAVVYLCTATGAYTRLKPAVRIANSGALTNGGVSAAATSMVWGNFATATSRWTAVGFGVSTYASSVYNLAYPAGLSGRPFATRPQMLDFDTKIRAVDGPTRIGDEWTITSRYDYALANIDPGTAPSPRQSWRSLSDDAQIIAWTVAPSVSPLRGALGAMYLGGINFRTATLEGRNGAGTWVTVGTVDASAGAGPLAWTNTGGVVEPTSGVASTASYFWPYGSLDGARFVDDTAAGTVYLIQSQAEGNWNTAASKRARLLITEDTSGLGASGTTGAIIHRSALLVWNNDPDFNAYRLTIPNQPNREGYYEIGVCVLGHVLAFGRRYSWGRQLATTTNTDLTTGRSGFRRAVIRGPVRRSVEFGWTDGVDVTMVRSASPDDFVYAGTTGTDVAAAAHDAPLSVAGLVSQLAGAATPVVYLPWIERKASGTVYQASHPDLMMYGRIVSDVSVEVVQGEEWVASGEANGEVVRTSTVRLEEEV